MNTMITSVHNPRVKRWAELLTKKGREEQGRYLVEGIHLVQEALQAGCEVECIAYALDKPLPRELQPYRSHPCEWIAVSEQVLKKCTSTQTPQGVFAVVAKQEAEENVLWQQERPLVIVLDQVQDPGNVGTIIRSAEASGATAMILGKGSADLYNPKTVRATMGAMFRIPILEGDLVPYLRQAKKRGIPILSTGLEASRTCYEWDWRKPVWFIIGNEGAGVSAAAAAEVDEMITIPMLGKAESLNAAMAATVLLFEAMRQRAFSINNL